MKTSDASRTSGFVLLLDGSKPACYGRENSSLQTEIDVARAFKKASSLSTTVSLWGWYSVDKVIDVNDKQCLKNWIPSPLPSLLDAVSIMESHMNDGKNKRFVILSDGETADDVEEVLDKMEDFFSANPKAVIDLVFMPRSISPDMTQLASRLYFAFPGQVNLHLPETRPDLKKTMKMIAASADAKNPPFKKYTL